jgi:transcriptional regulator with XRE-family HTH domain
MRLADKIKRLRKERGWSQAELAERLGVHDGHISRIETGKYQPSVDVLWKLARTLEVSADYLLDEEAGEFAPISTEGKPLAERLRLLEALDETEKAAVVTIIDALLTKKKVVDLVTHGAAA